MSARKVIVIGGGLAGITRGDRAARGGLRRHAGGGQAQARRGGVVPSPAAT